MKHVSTELGKRSNVYIFGGFVLVLVLVLVLGFGLGFGFRARV